MPTDLNTSKHNTVWYLACSITWSLWTKAMANAFFSIHHNSFRKVHTACPQTNQLKFTCSNFVSLLTLSRSIVGSHVHQNWDIVTPRLRHNQVHSITHILYNRVVCSFKSNSNSCRKWKHATQPLEDNNCQRCATYTCSWWNWLFGRIANFSLCLSIEPFYANVHHQICFIMILEIV